MKNPPQTTDKNKDLPIFVKWLDFLEWLLPVTERFPKRVRFTFSDRINQLSLDVVEDLVEARYAKNNKNILERINLRLEKLRVLLRLSNRLRYLDHDRHERDKKFSGHAFGRPHLAGSKTAG